MRLENNGLVVVPGLQPLNRDIDSERLFESHSGLYSVQWCVSTLMDSHSMPLRSHAFHGGGGGPVGRASHAQRLQTCVSVSSGLTRMTHQHTAASVVTVDPCALHFSYTRERLSACHAPLFTSLINFSH